MKPWVNLAAAESSTRKQISKKNKFWNEEWVDNGILVQPSQIRILKFPSLLIYLNLHTYPMVFPLHFVVLL